MQSSKILPGFLHFEKEEWNRYYAHHLLLLDMRLSDGLLWNEEQNHYFPSKAENPGPL